MYTRPMSKKAKLLWMDLEMTGLDPVSDRILEVAIIVTDWSFNELAVYESAIRVDESYILERMKVSQAFWDANPEARDGLLSQNSKAKKDAKAVEAELIKLVDENFRDELVLLAGNSIHQDRKFIENEWPELNKKLHYRMLDVSAWKVVFEGKYRKRFVKPEEHRALGDIRGSIMELQYYLTKVRMGKQMIREGIFHEAVMAYDDIYVDDSVDEKLRAYRYSSEDGDFVALVYRNSHPLRISLRCDAKLSKLLREKYETVLPAENLNKKYWNTILCTGQLPEDEIYDLLRLSYQLTSKKGPLEV